MIDYCTQCAHYAAQLKSFSEDLNKEKARRVAAEKVCIWAESSGDRGLRAPLKAWRKLVPMEEK